MKEILHDRWQRPQKCIPSPAVNRDLHTAIHKLIKDVKKKSNMQQQASINKGKVLQKHMIGKFEKKRKKKKKDFRMLQDVMKKFFNKV